MTRAIDFPHPTVEITCKKCGRRGRYSRFSFAALVGSDTQLPDALARIAGDCTKRTRHFFGGERCGAIYPQLLEEHRRGQRFV